MIYCLSVGCAVLAITTGKKKDTVVCLVGARSLLRPKNKKIQSSVWQVVLLCQFLVLAGNWQFFLLWREIFITTGKKRYSRLSGGCAMIITTGKKRYSHLSLVAIVIFVLVQLELNLIQIH